MKRSSVCDSRRGKRTRKKSKRFDYIKGMVGR